MVRQLLCSCLLYSQNRNFPWNQQGSLQTASRYVCETTCLQLSLTIMKLTAIRILAKGGWTSKKYWGDDEISQETIEEEQHLFFTYFSTNVVWRKLPKVNFIKDHFVRVPRRFSKFKVSLILRGLSLSTCCLIRTKSYRHAEQQQEQSQ